MHPDRNVTCESRRKMVARQRRERSAGGEVWVGGGLREPAAAACSLPPSLPPRERRAQGVERLGVILSLSPCPPRVGLRAPTARERRGGRGQGRAAATYPTPPDPGRIPPPAPYPHRQPPSGLPPNPPPTASRLYSRPEAWQWAGEGNTERWASPHSRRRRRRDGGRPPKPCRRSAVGPRRRRGAPSP